MAKWETKHVNTGCFHSTVEIYITGETYEEGRCAICGATVIKRKGV